MEWRNGLEVVRYIAGLGIYMAISMGMGTMGFRSTNIHDLHSHFELIPRVRAYLDIGRIPLNR